MINKKIKLIGLGNEGDYNFYIFEKKLGIMGVISKVLCVLGLRFNNTKEIYDENDKPLKMVQRNIKNLDIYHESYGGINKKLPRADIFYAEDKVILIVHCNSKLRMKFNKVLYKYVAIPTPKKK